MKKPRKGLVVLQELKQWVKRDGWTRRLFYAYTITTGGARGAGLAGLGATLPDVLGEEDAGALRSLLARGGSVQAYGVQSLGVVELAPLEVLPREMRLAQKREALQARRLYLLKKGRGPVGAPSLSVVAELKLAAANAWDLAHGRTEVQP